MAGEEVERVLGDRRERGLRLRLWPPPREPHCDAVEPGPRLPEGVDDLLRDLVFVEERLEPVRDGHVDPRAHEREEHAVAELPHVAEVRP